MILNKTYTITPRRSFGMCYIYFLSRGPM